MNGTGVGSYWLWPLLTLVLAGLWIWTARQLRHARSRARPVASERTHESVEAEDALKAAYDLEEMGDVWDGQALARSMDLPTAIAGNLTGALLAFGWAEDRCGTAGTGVTEFDFVLSDRPAFLWWTMQACQRNTAPIRRQAFKPADDVRMVHTSHAGKDERCEIRKRRARPDPREILDGKRRRCGPFGILLLWGRDIHR